jgi:predicted transcriptional regulator
MTNRTFDTEATIKIKQLLNEGISVLQEVETLNEGLNETVKAIAQELEIKASVLKKAIKLAHKSGLTQHNKDHEELNQILEVAGKTA